MKLPRQFFAKFDAASLCARPELERLVASARGVDSIAESDLLTEMVRAGPIRLSYRPSRVVFCNAPRREPFATNSIDRLGRFIPGPAWKVRSAGERRPRAADSAAYYHDLRSLRHEPPHPRKIAPADGAARK